MRFINGRWGWGKIFHQKSHDEIHWKMQLSIHWTFPVKIHWECDNPLENTAEQWQFVGKRCWTSIGNYHWKSTMTSEVFISGVQSSAPIEMGAKRPSCRPELYEWSEAPYYYIIWLYGINISVIVVKCAIFCPCTHPASGSTGCLWRVGVGLIFLLLIMIVREWPFRIIINYYYCHNNNNDDYDNNNNNTNHNDNDNKTYYYYYYYY